MVQLGVSEEYFLEEIPGEDPLTPVPRGGTLLATEIAEGPGVNTVRLKLPIGVLTEIPTDRMVATSSGERVTVNDFLRHLHERGVLLPAEVLTERRI